MSATAMRFIGGVIAAAVTAGSAAAQDYEGKKPLRFFISGHSLTDDPLGGYLSVIADSKGYDGRWDEQIVIGSPIRARTAGLDNASRVTWPGYSIGKDRLGRHNTNVPEKFSKWKAAGRPFNALIVTEGHKALLALRWNDTARYLRHYRDRFVAVNPDGRVYFHQSWEALQDLTKPQDWIAIEKQTEVAWSCVTDRINASLEHEGQKNLIVSLPIGLGVAHLLEKVMAGAMPGVAPANPEAAVKVVVNDDVHLTRLGVYYAALLVFVGMTNEPVEKAWAPDFVKPDVAAFLQKTAWDFHAAWRASHKPRSMAECRAAMVKYCPTYNSYVPDEWSAPVNDCETFFSSETPTTSEEATGNPFVFDAATDSKYWYAKK